MLEAVESPYLVPFDGSFRVEGAPTTPPTGVPDEDALEDAFHAWVNRLSELQRMLYAHDRFAVLLVFQAMDAGGKDGTIRLLTTGVNPAGLQVSFKQPSAEQRQRFLSRIEEPHGPSRSWKSVAASWWRRTDGGSAAVAVAASGRHETSTSKPGRLRAGPVR